MLELHLYLSITVIKLNFVLSQFLDNLISIFAIDYN